MPQVKTAEGMIDCPPLEDIGPRTKYWASVIRDVIRTEEMYMVMGAALEEAYRAGGIQAMTRFMAGLGKMEEVIDAEFEVVEGASKVSRDEGKLEGGEELGREGRGAAASREATPGPEPAEPTPADLSCESVRPAPSVQELSGSDTEGTECERSDAEKVEEGHWHVEP